MSTLKFCISLFIFLIFFHSASYSQERIETTITQEEAGKIILLFPTKGLNKEALVALTAELPQGTFAIGTKEGKTVAVISKGTVELKGIEEAVAKLDSGQISVNLRSMINAFKGFKVEQVEIWVSMIIEAGGVTKLLVSGKGEGGIKVLLKPGK